MRKVKLTEAEAEFVAEMTDDDNEVGTWRHFDPDFKQTEIARLLKRGWFERRGSPPYRSYAITDLGRAALAEEGRE